MATILNGVGDGLRLIFSGDQQVIDTTLRTLRVGFEATALASLIGIPAGTLLGSSRFRGRSAGLSLTHAGLALPPVAVGQILWILMWPSSRWGGGPLAGLGWLYTLNAVILAQTILALPIVTALVAAAVQRVPSQLVDQAHAFGASRLACAVLALREARAGVAAAVIAGLGTAIATVGAILIVGTSLGQATLATATVSTWNSGGDDARAVAYGTILLLMFLLLAALMTVFQQRWTRWLAVGRS